MGVKDRIDGIPHGVIALLRDREPERRALAEHVLLADELVQRARPHAGGERLVLLGRLLGHRKEGLLRHQLTIEVGRNIVRWVP